MDENPAAMFNELNSLAHEILSKVEKDIGSAREELIQTQRAYSDAEDEVKVLMQTRQDLSAKLAKSQEARRNLESERDYLRGEVSKLRGEISRLNDSYQNLAANLREAQAESRNYKTELITLRGKIAQVQKLLAG